MNMEVETGIEPVYKVLQTFASPLGHSTVGDFRLLHSTKRYVERMTRLELATLTLAR